jgi:two-component system, NarL family, response regulator NreC
MPTRVLIALGRQVWRDSFRLALTTWAVEVVGETGDGRDAVSLAAKLRPDVVVVEANLPGLNGPDVVRGVITESPGVSVIVISAHADWELVTRAMKAGASAYVLDDGGLEELKRAFDAVVEGRVYLSPAAEMAVLGSLGRLTQDEAAHLLTPREREVLQLLAEGKPTKEAADILNVSVKTIETHRRQVMRKLGIYSIAGLTKFAIRTRIISLDDES